MTDKPTDEIERRAEIPQRVKDMLEKLIPDDGSMGREILANFWLAGHSAAKEEVEGKISLLECDIDLYKQALEMNRITMEAKVHIAQSELDALKKEKESLIKQKTDIYMTLTKENFALKTAQKDLVEAADDWVRECEEECNHQPTWQRLSILLARHRKVGE